MYKTEEISDRIRSMRDLCGYTIDDMAGALGMSPQEYMGYESGKNDLTFTFLYKCAEIFDIDMVELITGENPRLKGYTVVQDGMGLPIKKRAGHEYYHLAPYFKDKMAEPFLVQAPYYEEEQEKEVPTESSEGQEFYYVVAGSLRFVYDGHEENLIAGDSVYFDSSKPHGMIATSKDGCTLLIITMKGSRNNDP